MYFIYLAERARNEYFKYLITVVNKGHLMNKQKTLRKTQEVIL